MNKSFFLLLTLVFIYACSKVPLTDRRQLNLIPDSQLISSSFTSYDEVIKESTLSSNTQQTQMVRQVGNRIKDAVDRYLKNNGHEEYTDGFAWEFNLIAENTINAWCMPGGKVAFYEGILPVCQDEAGIAVVMGHEVAHAIANHGGERMSQALVQQLGGVALSVALREQPEQTKSLAMAAYTGGSTVLGTLPFSRLHESEADQMGLTFMAMAGYNPEEAPKFWERMKANAGSSTPEFLSTHPSSDRRINDLNSWMSDAKSYYQSSNKATNNPIPNLSGINSGKNTNQEKESTATPKIKLKIDN